MCENDDALAEEEGVCDGDPEDCEENCCLAACEDILHPVIKLVGGVVTSYQNECVSTCNEPDIAVEFTCDEDLSESDCVDYYNNECDVLCPTLSDDKTCVANNDLGNIS